MADEIVIETTSAEVIEVGVPGPQGPAGAAGAGLTTLTTAGDLLYRNNSEATRLPIGSNGQVLKVSGGLPAWANESGAVTSVNGATGAVTVAAATHATEHEAGEADEIQAMAALVTTDDASLNGIYVPNASGTTSGGRLTLYKTGTRQNTKLEYNQSLSIWQLIKNAVVQLSGQEINAAYAWTTQQWLDERSPQVLPNGGTVTRAGLEVLARRAADGTSNVATATTSEDGLLSSTDKTKLNGIAANATANTASSATPSALGTASAGSATDYARADHVHSAEVSDSAFRVFGSTDATKKVALEVDTNVPANTTVTLTAPSASGTLALAGAAPAAHASTHHTGGTDALAAHQINGQTIFGTGSVTHSTDQTLGAARALQLTVSNTNASGINLTLPAQSDGTLNGDTYVIIGGSTISGSITIRRINLFSPLIYQTLATITATGQQYRFRSAGGATGSWSLVPVDTHTHAAADITSGTLSNDRVNFAAPAAIGSTTPAAGTFTNLVANTELQLPSAAPASPSAGDIYRVTDTIRYRDSGNAERLLLNATDNLSNLANTATARTNIGLGIADAVTFGSLQNTPIGSTTRNSGAFTTLSAAPTSGSALTLTGGTVTTSAPVIDATQTWNASGTTFTALRLNATNTASATASLLMDLQIGGTTQFSVRRDGVVNAGLYYRFTGLNSGLFVHSAGGGVISIGDNPNNWMTLTSTRMQLTGDLSLGRALSAGQSADTILARDAANTLALINSTNPQIYRVYGTASGTSNANFERLAFVAQSAGSFLIDTQKGGTGSARGLELRTDGTARITISSTGGIGFYGAAASAQPAAVADATDAASTQASLNDLLARLRTIGIIAT